MRSWAVLALLALSVGFDTAYVAKATVIPDVRLPEVPFDFPYTPLLSGLPVTIPSNSLPAGPALAPGPSAGAAAPRSSPAPLYSSLVSKGGPAKTSTSLSVSAGGVTATASSNLGGGVSRTTAGLTFCDCILVHCLRCQDCMPPDKCSWPECVGMNAEEAVTLIAGQTQAVPILVRKGSAVTMDYRGDRVRVVYDPTTMLVVVVPSVG